MNRGQRIALFSVPFLLSDGFAATDLCLGAHDDQIELREFEAAGEFSSSEPNR